MNKSGKIKFGIFFEFFMISIIAFSFIFAGDLSLDKKIYDSKLQEVTIKNDLNIDAVKIKLLTPLNYHRGQGYTDIAQYEVNSFESLKILVSKMEFYDVKNSMNEINRQIDYKIKGTEQVIINDYENICEEEWNETSENNSISCTQEIIGNHTEEKIVWNDLSKVNFNKDEKIIVGLFTNVQKGDKVEWIPTFEIDNQEYRIEEWATWTADLNVGLKAYWNFETSSGTDVATGLNNVSYTGAGANSGSATGKIGKALSCDGSAYAMNSTPLDIPIGDSSRTINFWTKTPVQAHNQGMFAYGSNNGTRSLFLILISTTPSIDFGLNGDDGTIRDGAPIDWEMITIRYTAGSNFFETFVNGTSIYNKSLGGPINSNQALLVFCNFAHDFGYISHGLIDEIGIWNRSLTVDEVTQLYNGGVGITYTNVFNTAPTIIANATSPSSVYTNTDFEVNLTITDADSGDTLTGYVSFYVNDSIIGTYSNTATNNTNTLIATLGSGNFSKTNNLTAEIWAGDGTENTTKVNLTEVLVLNSAPVITTTQVSVSQDSGGTYAYDYNGTDADSDTLTWSDNTTLFNIGSSDGIISDSPTESEHGTYSILINLSDGTTTDTDAFEYTINDATPPTLTAPANATLEYLEESLGVDFDATDGGVGLDTFKVNDTTNFQINSTGYLSNKTALSVADWEINVSVNDTSGNTNWTIYKIVVQDTAPTITITSPTAYQNISTNSVWFNASSYQTIDTWIVNYNGTNITLSSIDTSLLVLDGDYSLKIYANDTAGTWGLNDSINFSVDTITPVIATSLDDMEEIAFEFPTGNGTFTLNYNVTDEHFKASNYSIYYPNSTLFLENASGSSNQDISMTLYPENVGTFQWNIYANDSMGWYQSKIINFQLSVISGMGGSSTIYSLVKLNETSVEGMEIQPEKKNYFLNLYENNKVYFLIGFILVLFVLAGKKNVVIKGRR